MKLTEATSKNPLAPGLSDLVSRISCARITRNLTQMEIESVNNVVENLDAIEADIERELTEFKKTYKEETGKEPKPVDSSPEGIFRKIEAATQNKKRVRRTSMFCGRIARNAIAATASGTCDTTPEALMAEVMKLTEATSKNPLAPGLSDLVSRISCARITRNLTQMEIESVNNVVENLDAIEADIERELTEFKKTYKEETGKEPKPVDSSP